MTGITRDLSRLQGQFRKEAAMLVKVGSSSRGEQGAREALEAAGRLEIRVSVAAGSRLLSPSATHKGRWGREEVESNCVAKSLL